MAREIWRKQISRDSLKQDKQRWMKKARDGNSEHAVCSDLQAEINRYKEKNRLRWAIRESQKHQERHSLDKSLMELEAKVLLEQQRLLNENLQAELAEVVERNFALEMRRCSLEEQICKVHKQAELERLRALEAFRSKCEDREDWLVQQLQDLQQVRKLQSRKSVEESCRQCSKEAQPTTRTQSEEKVTAIHCNVVTSVVVNTEPDVSQSANQTMSSQLLVVVEEEKRGNRTKWSD